MCSAQAYPGVCAHGREMSFFNYKYTIHALIMNRKLTYTIALGAALALTSCGKKLGQFVADNFKVNPNPLEVVGERVPATVTANVPAKFFEKNAEVTVTRSPIHIRARRSAATILSSTMSSEVLFHSP